MLIARPYSYEDCLIVSLVWCCRIPGRAGEEEAVPVEGAPPAGGVKLRDMHGDSSAVQRPGSAGRHPELREDGRSQGAAALGNQGAVHCSFLPYTTVASV